MLTLVLDLHMTRYSDAHRFIQYIKECACIRCSAIILSWAPPVSPSHIRDVI